MDKKKVVLFGSTGMLGSMIRSVLSKNQTVDLINTGRLESNKKEKPGFIPFDANNCSTNSIKEIIKTADYVINAIGIIKPYIHENVSSEIENAIKINSLFPYNLALVAESEGCKVIQIATDCVFSGREGGYLETSPHDPLDAYGKTKSLGEVPSPSCIHLRCSIIGPEQKSYLSLLEWFKKQPNKAHLSGYINHHWNGITTYHFAKICDGIINNNISLPIVQHIIPLDIVSKYELLHIFVSEYNRDDLSISQTKAEQAVNRTLGTTNKNTNMDLWKAAGYAKPLSIQEMVHEMKIFESHQSFGQL